MKNKKNLRFIFLIIFMMFSLTGCGHSDPANVIFETSFNPDRNSVLIYNSSDKNIDDLDLVLSIKGDSFNDLTISKHVQDLTPHEERIIPFKDEIPQTYNISSSSIEVNNATIYSWETWETLLALAICIVATIGVLFVLFKGPRY